MDKVEAGKTFSDQITNQVQQISGSDVITNQILDIASKIDFHWFEWAFKVGLVTVGFLFFKDLIYSAFRYFMMRADKYVGIGAIVKLEDGSVGRLADYDLKNVSIETIDGIVRVPLEVWQSKSWTQLKEKNLDISLERKKRESLEVQLIQLKQELENIKTNTITPPSS